MKKVVLFIIMFLLVLNVKAEETNSIVSYFSLESGEKITIDITNGCVVSLVNSNKKFFQNSNIEIKDFNNYRGIFMTFDNEKYPLYIIETSEGYSFSDFRKSDNSIKSSYILASSAHSLNFNSLATNVSTCESLLGYQFINLLKNNVFKIIYYLIPIIFIITSTIDFAKLVFFEDKNGVPGAFNKLLRRIIAALLIFLVPTILTFFTNIFGSEEVKTCITTFQNTENLDRK